MRDNLKPILHGLFDSINNIFHTRARPRSSPDHVRHHCLTEIHSGRRQTHHPSPSFAPNIRQCSPCSSEPLGHLSNKPCSPEILLKARTSGDLLVWEHFPQTAPVLGAQKHYSSLFRIFEDLRFLHYNKAFADTCKNNYSQSSSASSGVFCNKQLRTTLRTHLQTFRIN